MEMETQAFSTPSSPRAYVTAPASPTAYGRTGSSMEYYYSAPSSPRRKTGDAAANIGAKNQITCDDPTSKFDDFEFETSKKFSGQLHFETGNDQTDRCLEREDSLPAMAFADELFLNGLVMPLKLPPRLQFDSDVSSFSRTSPVLSPKSPRTVCRIPFARRNAWNNEFDPFMVALQKVREEKRGRNGGHRRSRSYSPFRALSKCSSDIDSKGQDLCKGNSQEKAVQVINPSFSGPLDFKGSSYARWVRDQTREGGINPRRSKSPRGFLFGQRVRPVKTEPDKQTSAREKCGKTNYEESKVQKLKGIIWRYASFGRGNSKSRQAKITSEVRNTSYLSRLSFKFKGNAHGDVKKIKLADTTMAVVEYKPSVALCLGYGVGSPGNMNR